eukprot:gene13653-18322_t
MNQASPTHANRNALDDASSYDDGSNGEEAAKIKIEENNLRVTFAVPKAKQIVSYHSGTILANAPNRVSASFDAQESSARVHLISTAQSTFDNYLKSKSSDHSEHIISADNLPELVIQCGFKSELSTIKRIVNELFIEFDTNNESNINRDKFVSFMSYFHAPEYYFGQRLRKYASRGQLKEFSDLLVRNCNPNAADGEGLTSLHYACEYNQVPIIQLMVNKISKENLIIDARDRYGWTPLYCAAHHGNIDCVKLLLEIGADVHIKNLSGKTALHAACARGKTSIVEILLIHGASLLEMDNNEMTPLHEAAYRGHIGLCKLLMKKNESLIDLKDKLGYTANDYMSLIQ